MAWSFNNTTKVLTSTGAIISSPDSLLAGIASIQALDTTRGYVNGYIGWINNVFISISAGSFIQFDADSQIEFRGSTYMKLAGSTGGGIIHGYRSTLLLNTTTARIDGVVSLPTGSTFACLRERPNDPSARIIAKHTVRYDYPTILKGNILNTINIDGLDFYANSSAFTVLKAYFGQATNINVNNVRFFNFGPTSLVQKYSTTYNDGYYESLNFNSETTTINTIIDNRPTFYLSTPAPFSGNLWVGQITLVNPTFLNNCWDQTVNLNNSAPGLNVDSFIRIYYTYTNIIKNSFLVLEGVKCRFERYVYSYVGSSSWQEPPGEIQELVTDANGSFSPINLYDFSRGGTSPTDYQRYKHKLEVRKYDYKTKVVFQDRIMYKGAINMSQGYTEEVQMIPFSTLTLNEAQAAALTGISISTGGFSVINVTITQNRTVLEIWHYYRYWISQFVNINSDTQDFWDFSGENLITYEDLGWIKIGDANFNISSTVTGNFKTIGTVTFSAGGSVEGVYTDSAGIHIQVKSPNILSGSRVQLYDLTSNTELFNAVLSSNGFNYSTIYTASNTYRLRIAKTGYLPIELTAVVTDTGLLFSGDNQIADTVYNAIGIVGSTVTEFSTDYINLQIDVSDLDYQTTFQRLYAWFRYIETTSLGISNYFNGLYATDEVNFVVRSSVVSLKLDNVLTTPVKITGGSLTRDDGQTIIASTSNSIQIDPLKSYIANSQFIIEKLNNIPTNTLTVSKFLALK